jgi:ATP-dependent DNA helicase RecG
MKLDELIERLQGYEWNDFEVKEARNEVPGSMYETVSAFANTAGGWIVLGVKCERGQYEITGVNDVDRVQNDFLNVLNGGQKLNRRINSREFLVQSEGKSVLLFYIPESSRQEKPVYLNRNIWKSFIRRGGCDHQCTTSEVEGFLRDSSTERYDSQTLELDVNSCFNEGSISWYRILFYKNRPEEDSSISNEQFLYDWGYLLESSGRRLPTRASILLFGSRPATLQILPRPIVDCQWINASWSAELPEERWADRLVLENNLIESWKALLNRYQQWATRPFSLETETLQRSDEPPDYLAFREAAINLLIHQDYGDHTRIPRIQFFQDGTAFFNPGDAFVSPDQLLEPGEREVRNPRIVNAFRRIGLSEQAGTGVRAIFQNWRQLKCVPPMIVNDKSSKFFRLTLLKEKLLSEEQILFQAKLGLNLTEQEASTFALVCRQGQLRLIDVKMVTGCSHADCHTILSRLKVQALIEPISDDLDSYFVLAEHLRTLLAGSSASDPSEVLEGSLISDQPATVLANLISDQPKPLTELTEVHWKIIEFCDVPRSLSDLMDELDLTHRPYFKRNYLKPLMDNGLLKMTYPDKPNHPKQSYVLTEAGVRLKVTRLQ